MNKNIVNLINEFSKSINENQNILNLTLLYILRNSPYFMGNYEYLNIDFDKKNKSFNIINNKLNNIKGLTNKNLQPTILTTSQDYYIDIKKEETENINLIVSEKDLLRLKIFKSILNNCNNIKDIKNSLDKENEKDPDFIFNISYILSNNEKNILELMNLKTKKGFFKTYEKFSNLSDFEEEFFYGFSKIAKKSKIGLIKEIVSENFQEYNFKELVRSPLNLNPESISTKKERIIFLSRNKLNGKLNNSLLHVLIKSKNKEQLIENLINKYLLEEKKEEMLHNIDSIIKNNSIEFYFEKYYEKINKVYNQVLNVFPFLKEKPNKNNLKIDIIEKKDEDEILEIFKNQSLKIYKSVEIDSATRGLEFSTFEGLTNNYFKEVFFIIKNENDIIGFSKINTDPKKENQVYNLATISVKENFKNQGISKILLESIANYCVDNKKILEISMYTEDGSKYLPNNVENIKNKTGAIILQSDLKGNLKVEFIKDFEKTFADYAKHANISYENKVNIYKKFLEIVKNENPSEDFLENFKIKNKIFEEMAKDFERFIKNKKTFKNKI